MPERRAFEVRGIVQGVGFRPFVHSLACRHDLAGFVQNRFGGVHIEVEGPGEALDRFERALVADAPAGSRIHDLARTAMAPAGSRDFSIAESDATPGAPPPIGPDVATCDACLADVRGTDPRRSGYAFVTCADCGPRFTAVTGAPYDRERTTLARFPMCADCRREHEDPRDRRFHAEGIVCRACGPRLSLHDGTRGGAAGAGAVSGGDEPISAAARALLDGRIVAVKGIGGYHLACLAADEAAASELRRRKARDDKPFAVLVRDLEEARSLALVTDEEAALLASRARPIVLVRGREGAVAPSVAPRSGLLGLMLPCSPLHHLLVDELARLSGQRGVPIVLTSGNRAGEPIPFEDEDARARLFPLADLVLSHDRPIASRCDDSVARVVLGAPVLLRRSRGLAPAPMWLPWKLGRPTLAVGGHMKSTFCLGHGDTAVLSHHLGDLDHPDAEDAFTSSIRAYETLHGVRPERIVHDLHPDYASTRYALERARNEGLECIAVQHHHAHFAACLAEHGLTGRALGVCFDGTGDGGDGTVWGAELLLGDAASVTRAGHFAEVPLPGGERAVREGFRMAIAHALAAGIDPLGLPLAARVGRERVARVARIAESRALSPLASSAGRLFDAVAALAGVRDVSTFDGQAAIELESLAMSSDDEGSYPHEITLAGGALRIETAPLIRAVVRDVAAGVEARHVARRFHRAVADLVVVASAAACDHHRVADVALSGGVFANALLLRDAVLGLRARGIAVHRHEAVPPGDGGISFGQLAVVAGRDTR